MSLAQPHHIDWDSVQSFDELNNKMQRMCADLDDDLISITSQALGMASTLITHGVLVGSATSPTAKSVNPGTSGQVLTSNGSGADPTFAAPSVADTNIVFSDVATGNVSSTKHGFAPKSPADATKFLNGAATPNYAQVKDSDLSTSDITTNNVSITKHGFAPKAPNDATKFLDGTGAYSVPAGSGGGGAMARVLSTNTTVATGTSQLISESLEVGAGVILEVAGGALLEITGEAGNALCGGFITSCEQTGDVNVSTAGTVDWLVVNAATNPVQSSTNPPAKFLGPNWLFSNFNWSLSGAATVATNNDNGAVTTNAGDGLLGTPLASQVTSGVVFTSTGAQYGWRFRVPCQRRKLVLRFQVLAFNCYADITFKLSNNARAAQTYRVMAGTPGGGQGYRAMFKVVYFGENTDLIVGMQCQSSGLAAGQNPNVGVHGIWIAELDS